MKKRSCYSYGGKKCPVRGCKSPMRDIGYCAKHAQRFRRYGDVHYVTPEKDRAERNRLAQPKLGKCKKTTYKKRFGRHEHRLIVEKILGRKLKRGEIVHHKDGNRHNNDPKNLEVMTQSEHARVHFAKT